MEARNRKIKEWHEKVRSGEIKLPRFQRHEAWDRKRIGSLIETVIHDLPLGITLILEVGDEEKFISRYLVTAPETSNKVHEHLLDGQQRLTSLWRAFHNNYERESFYVYFAEFDDYDKDEEREDLTIHCQSRWIKKSTGEPRPVWCEKPAGCLKRGLIPTELFRPEDIAAEIDEWISVATKPLEPASGSTDELKAFFGLQKRIGDCINELRSTVANYNLPFLSLPATTDKSVALQVFINMNTNSKPLSAYDIIVAEVESVMGQSLHDLESGLQDQYPNIARYGEMSDLILTTSALLQGYPPNQRGAWDMDKQVLVENWPQLEKCLSEMARFIESEGIYDSDRLPTKAVLAPIAALYSDIPAAGDKRGSDEQMLRKYLWHSFLTERYENSAATHAYADFNSLKALIKETKHRDGRVYKLEDVPIFANHELPNVDVLLTADWPKRKSILGRGVFAVICRLGALDFSTGQQLTADNIGSRHYHHVYPNALLKEADIPSFLALNCALIADKTNLAIGRKDPVVYLKDRYKWASDAVVKDRLHSHLIPVPELANGGYEGLPTEAKNVKLANDFNTFIQRRAELVVAALDMLVSGRQLNLGDVYLQAKGSEDE